MSRLLKVMLLGTFDHPMFHGSPVPKKTSEQAFPNKGHLRHTQPGTAVIDDARPDYSYYLIKFSHFWLSASLYCPGSGRPNAPKSIRSLLSYFVRIASLKTQCPSW
jgi:hypothetical protein